MPDPTYQQIHAVVLEVLRRLPQGQYGQLGEAVVRAAASKSLIVDPGESGRRRGHSGPVDRIYSLVHEALWECIVRGIVVPGMDNANDK
jgi:hypothetical protein